MKRRQILAIAGFSALPLSGCVYDNEGNGTTEDPTPDEVPEGRNLVSVSITHEVGNKDISFNYEVHHSEITDESPAVIELIARNGTGSKIEYGTGAPKPFGALYDPDMPEAVLWTNKYAESQYVQTSDRRITGIDDIGLIVTLSPGESISETYEFAASLGTYSMKRTGNPISLGEDTYELEVTVSEA